MKKVIIAFLIGFFIGSAIGAVAAGVTKFESGSLDAASIVGYGTADSGDTIVRIKTDSDGVLQIKGV